MFFIYGNEPFLINNKVSEIIKKHPNHKIIELNSLTSLNELVNELVSFSIFDDNKLIVVKNSIFLDKNNKSTNEMIINALSFIPESTIIIFTYDKQNSKQKNELFNYLLKNSKCFEFNELNDKEMTKFVKDKVSELGGFINDVNLVYLLTKLPNKLTIINNELEKLISFDKNITKTNIDNLVPKYEQSKIFDFINSFNDRNIDKMFEIYHEKINQGESVLILIKQIINVLDLCSQIHSYKHLNYSENDIANELNKHIFIIKKNNNLLTKISYKKVSYYIEMLAKLDMDIKTYKIDENIGFENFLIQIMKD